MKRRKASDARRARHELLASLPADERSRHHAVRSCAGCGRRDLRERLRRFGVVGSSAGTPVPSSATLDWRAAGGRGAYLHPAPACMQRFLAAKPLIVSLRARADRMTREALLASTAGI